MKIDKLKKLVGDKNKGIKHYFNSIEETFNWISENIVNPKRFTIDELKGIVSDNLSRENNQKKEVKKTATELLNSIGYEIVKTNSLSHLKELGFEEWFEPDDVWCKYNDDNRWKRYDIYLIWKKDGKDIKPMTKPKVNDEYSLSLMSLGCKEGQIFQICQRYNHNASGSADWALNGNLNNLINGLTEAFCKEFNYTSIGESRLFMPEKTIVRHGKYLKYNDEYNDVYFYESGICTNEKYEYTDTERYTIVDNFVIDWKDKVVIDPANLKDGAIKHIQKALENGTLKIIKEK